MHTVSSNQKMPPLTPPPPPLRRASAPPFPQPIDPQRVRHLPRQFGALDRQFVYRGHIGALSWAETTLYVFLVCVGNPQGLSYYSDRRLAATLRLSAEQLQRARQRLLAHGLILYRPPLYQLLDLPSDPNAPAAPAPAPVSAATPRRAAPAPRPAYTGARSLAEILQQLARRHEHCAR